MGQITFMRLHDRYTDSFETGEVLNNAYNVKETRILNDTGSIEFDYPYDEKARLISQNMLVSVNGHIYEISRTTRNMNVRIHCTFTVHRILCMRRRKRLYRQSATISVKHQEQCYKRR